MKRLASVLFWSVIAAAFIGPGTVTSAASAGTGFGYALLWALVFSTVACLVLQEASARLTVVSGKNLGEALRARYPEGWQGATVLVLVLGAIVVGCAAYEAGNILGGAAGASLAVPWTRAQLTVGIGTVAVLLLWLNSTRRVAFLLSVLVALMGVAFLWTALLLAPSPAELLKGGLRPSLPDGSQLLAIALVGTTVVPYNLFLGSGLARGQTLSELRFGLTVAVVLGGLISMGVLVVGTAVDPPFSFPALAEVLTERLGPWSGRLFGLGLLAAGLSSAVTAPLAAAVTARSLFGGQESARWEDTSWRFRTVWLGVVVVGVAVGLSGYRPVPVIIAAQALNGVLLPVAAVFLLIAVNDRELMGAATNHAVSNAVMAVVTLVSIFLGVSNVARAAAGALGTEPIAPAVLAGVAGLLGLVALGLVARAR